MAFTETCKERDAIVANIRALLAKTTQSGATHAEALAAAEKAAYVPPPH